MARAVDVQGAGAARAAEIGGQAWGRAMEQAGQIPNQIMGNLRAQREEQAALRARDLQAQRAEMELKRARAGEKIGGLITQSTKITPDGHLLYDVDAFRTAAQQDPELASWAHEPLDAMTKANDSYKQWTEGRFANKKAVLSDVFARAAAAGGTADDLQLIALPYIKGQVLSEDDLGPMVQRLQSMPDEKARVSLLRAVGGIKPEYKEVPEGGTLVETTAGSPPQAVFTGQPKQKNPPSLEEQYLEAVTKGDAATSARILSTMKDTAAAKRDPAAVALASELGALRKETAQERLETMRKKAEPLDIEPDVQTTRSGRRYLDGSLYQGEERNKARAAAGTAGAVMVSKEQANALQEIDNARSNQRSIITQVEDLLPKGPGGRVIAGPATRIEAYFQTDERKAAFASWRTAAIQALRATAGSKGLRINQAEIAQAIENDIPKLSDTLGTARQKVANIETMLENAEKSILERDRSAPAGPTIGET
ncbi:MAG TPA: hypothetical protein VGQ19_19560, partial [Burkholderiales bacterium]|nr:hypothetical protein [Burkholderiales bacterium]